MVVVRVVVMGIVPGVCCSVRAHNSVWRRVKGWRESGYGALAGAKVMGSSKVFGSSAVPGSDLT